MRYFGIKKPDGEVWWIAEDASRAWLQFFGNVPNRSPIAEAIRAYESIGYKCVELDVREKPGG